MQIKYVVFKNYTGEHCPDYWEDVATYTSVEKAIEDCEKRLNFENVFHHFVRVDYE